MEKEIQELEKLLNVKFEKYDSNIKQANAYQEGHRKGSIRKLLISNTTIEDLNILLPFSNRLNRLYLTNCTIGNIKALLKFKWLNYFCLDNITILDSENGKNLHHQKDSRNLLQTELYDFSVTLKNMTINHVSHLIPHKELEYLTLINCHIHNFFEINLFPELYKLTLKNVTIKKTDQDFIYPLKSKRLIFFYLRNMDVENINYFEPISKNIRYIDIQECRIGSLREILKFPNLEQLEVDLETTIADKSIVENDKKSSPLLKECIIYSTPKDKVDLQQLVSIASNIKKLTFNECNTYQLRSLEFFTNLKALEFNKSKVALNDLLAVSKNIKSIIFNDSTIKKTKYLKYYTRLQEVRLIDLPKKGGLKTLKQLLPLSKQLKKMKLYDAGIKDLEFIKHFKKLESLDLDAVSVKTTKNVFTLKNLKKTSLNLQIKKSHAFDLKAIKNIKVLYITSWEPILLKGIKRLSKLETLVLNRCKAKKLHQLKKLNYLSIDKYIDINQTLTIKTLKKLIIDVSTKDNYEVHGLEQFPNLKKLQIKGTNKIKLGSLNHLKVLDIGNIYPEQLEYLDQLPKLEKLDLSYNDLSEITGLDKLTNLKWLDLSENFNIENVKGLESLKSLKYVNLYSNKVADISLLNNLKKLKEVNIAHNQISIKEARQQLKHPEVAIFCYLPRVPFIIWRREYFKL